MTKAKKDAVETPAIDALEVVISGSYYSTNHEVVDFEAVSGFIPRVALDLAKMHVQGRYAKQWIAAAVDPETDKKMYPKPWVNEQRIFDDSMLECEHVFPFVGTAIQDFTYEDIQDFATLYDLRTVPLHKAYSLREMRFKAWSAWCIMQGDDPKTCTEDDFKTAAPEVITIDLIAPRRDNAGRVSNEAVIAAEQANEDLRNRVDPASIAAQASVEDGAAAVRKVRAAPKAKKAVASKPAATGKRGPRSAALK